MSIETWDGAPVTFAGTDVTWSSATVEWTPWSDWVEITLLVGVDLAGTSDTLTYSVATLSVENISSSYAAYAGTVLVSEIRIGTTPVVAVYQGSTRVW